MRLSDQQQLLDDSSNENASIASLHVTEAVNRLPATTKVNERSVDEKTRPLVLPTQANTDDHDAVCYNTNKLVVAASDPEFGPEFMIGMTIASVASSILTTVFGLFHIDLFLQAYRLPLPTYSLGSFVFSIINTANDLVGAWFLDAIAVSISRSDLVGVSGCIFSICFLTPFFRPRHMSNAAGGLHFVATMSLYDTMYSFTNILMGSVVTDNHLLGDAERVRFMASGKVLNLLVSFLVARIGLEVFDKDRLRQFRRFVVLLSILVCVMFAAAHAMIIESPIWPFNYFRLRRKFSPSKRTDENKDPELTKSYPVRRRLRKLHLGRVFRDFCSHKNFLAWIAMEMLLECQVSFVMSFAKTFVDTLVMDAGISRDFSEWALSMIRPLTQILAICCYIPIRRFGYHTVYKVMFSMNLALSFLLLSVATPSSTYWIIGFLLVYPTVTGAVLASGFHLAMSDLVLEMKRKHALEDRLDEPSFAALFMGANALMCKPIESLLPIVAATFLGDTGFSSGASSSSSQRVLFYLLVGPPCIFSCLQLFAWSRFDLHPAKTRAMRDELRKIHSEDHLSDIT
jgi:hypothetical protein